MKRILFAMAMLLVLGFTASVIQRQIQSTDESRILGVWEPSHGRARVKIEKIGPKFFGKIVWLKEPLDPATNLPKVDNLNPDPALQSIPLKGLRILKDFTYAGNDEWSKGTIYDPLNGKTYKCVIRMRDINTLDIRGYIGIEAIGRTDVWKRVGAN